MRFNGPKSGIISLANPPAEGGSRCDYKVKVDDHEYLLFTDQVYSVNDSIIVTYGEEIHPGWHEVALVPPSPS